jgi:hypothetical protein
MASMNIVSVPGRYAVCRLSPEASLPSWILDCETTEFLSITRTEDELSIVCLEKFVPAPTEENSNIVVEKTWAVLKVQGPLDFALTGILTSLAQPLATAGISIFAISTYDTDYLLVKTDTLLAAEKVLTDAGHNVQILPENNGHDDDDLAVEFEADPLVAPLVVADVDGSDDGATFGLVVNAGWPAHPDLQEQYLFEFRSAVSDCFDDVDVKGSFEPAVYLYPASALHVTVANFHAFTLPPSVTVSEDVLAAQWKSVFDAATAMSEWPTLPLQLSIDRAQIGKRAGILLWKDTSGGMEAMRQCIRTAAKQLEPQLTAAGVSIDTLKIPGIVHSTFLRFYQVPTTPGSIVQERFQTQVVPLLEQMFPVPYPVTVAKLVCERRPYMHIPDDDHHVLATSSLLPVEK